MENTDLLRGERIRLTPMRIEDVPALARWWENGEFMRMYDAVPATPKTEAQIAKEIQTIQEQHNSFRFAIRDLANDMVFGQFEIDGIDWQHRVTYVGIVIFDPDRRGKGYGREAMELGLRFAFHELNLHRIALTVFAYNTQAIALYERLGFVHEGTHREYLERDGQRHDMLLYGLLRHEWEAGFRTRDVGRGTRPG